MTKTPLAKHGWVLEGGAIDVDGTGLVVTTEQCLLNPNRNPGLDRPQLEQLLCEWLGARTVVWLGQGVINDETDGHVDNMARFVAPGVVALTWTDDEDDPQADNPEVMMMTSSDPAHAQRWARAARASDAA